MRRLLLILSPAIILAFGVYCFVSSNRIEAVPSLTPDIQSNPLSRDVRAALIGAFGPDALDIVVGVDENVAVLSGDVRERSTQKLAGRVAESVDGIIVVHNFIDLTSGGETYGGDPRTQGNQVARDTALGTRVSHALQTKIPIDSPRISVEACDGVVLLSGRLPDSHHHDTAIRVAESLSGVTNVIDLIHVAWTGSFPVTTASFSEKCMLPAGIEK